MRTTLLALVLGVAAPLLLLAQPKPATVEFPCKLTDYRIPQPNTVAVRCDGVSITNFTADTALYKLQDESVVYPAVQSIEKAGSGPDASAFWLKFSLNQSLQPGQDYELRFSGSYQIQRPGNDTPVIEHFSATRFRFSTRPDLAVRSVKGRPGQKLSSHFAMQVSAGAKLIDHSNNNAEYRLEAASPDPNDYDAMGQILLVPAPSSLGQKIEVQGIADVFGQTPLVKTSKPAPPPAAPKSKDAAAWYFNFAHQAGVGITPSWIANIKVAPVLGGLPAGFFIAPSLNVDVGQGQVGQTKTNDLINPKLGVTRLVRTQAAILEAVRFASALSYETNRKSDKRNILFDGDSRIYFKALENTKAQRSQDAFLKARLQDLKILPQDVPKARFGYSIQLFLGIEIGSSLTDNTVKSSDKSSQVTVPQYAIRRLRPHFSDTFEFWNFTVSVSVYPRYLFSAENVTRENDTPQPNGKSKKTIVLHRASGWRPYGECSINYALDPAGHYAINTIYKLGSQPPNFDRANVFQSGILIRF